ncbi:MAG: Ig-like domain-containing protein [Candidatus Thermoplasmatota archaeon]|nr:Ig-like domain-containing protein [Candidatus Thermoplasmatota archaeon]
MNRTLALVLVSVICSSSIFLFGQDEGRRTEAILTSTNPARGDGVIFDSVLEIPPGGETRVRIDGDGIPRVEGYAGAYYFDHGKLGEAASLVPDWLREAFVHNMLKAASVPVQGNLVIPSFGDIDGDGDDDMALGRDGSLEIYMNVGWEGFPVFDRAEYDFWTSDHVQRTIEFESGGYLSPYLGYFNGDEYADLLLGTIDGYVLLSNPGNGSISRRIGSGRVEGLRISPTMVYKTTYTSEGQLMNNLAFVMGNANGDLITYEFFISESFNSTGSYPGTDLRISGIMPISSNANPRSWTHRRDLNDPGPFDLAIGSGEGTIHYYRFQNRIGSVLNYQLQENYYSGITSSSMMVPASLDMDGDGSSDLAIGTQDGGIPIFNNLQTSGDPYWRPLITSPASEATNYRSAFNDRLTIFNESLIEGYLDSIIDPVDPRYRDEIAFACAYTPPEQLRDSALVQIFNDNARYIYERAPTLSYVSLVEVPGRDGYTTARYNMKAGSEYLSIEIPRDIYYWGVVHPRITEEELAYIDPETGNKADPSSGGRFWREYLWEHADPSYPAGPVYPDDWTGPKAYYPTEFSPPLLKDVASTPLILWDMQPYEPPTGFDHAGEVNNRPWDLRDHAIEKVSHWVGKTLVLNKQESPENERPNQPVRIAHLHNGNCGELQDLTIAAARCALIPARGVLLMGEDHVWSEFYAGGWHQWDNYWSDSGGVIANSMNYWWEWGSRGGSGLFALMGDGSVEDVGTAYRPPDVTGSLSVYVRDARGVSVDGARVLVMSHWAMEQMSVDLGPYQAPPPVTAPLPAIWGYTDSHGRVVLNVWRQNFNIVVTSDLGSFVSQKFGMGDDEHKEIFVTLTGIAPRQDPGRDLYRSSFDEAHPVFVEVLQGMQEHTCFLSGASYRQNVEGPPVLCYVDEGGGYGSYSRSTTSNDPYIDVMSFHHGGNAVLVIRNTGSISTSAFVRVRINGRIDPGEKDLITYPNVGISGPDLLDPDPVVFGMAIVPERAWQDDIDNFKIGIVEASTGYQYPTIYGSFEHQYAMFITWSTTGFHVSMAGTKDMLVVLNITLDTGPVDLAMPFGLEFLDTVRPLWSSYTGSGAQSWGSTFAFGAHYYDMSTILHSIGWMDDELIWSGSFDRTRGRHPTGDLDSSLFTSGRHRLRISTWDPEHHITTLVFNSNFIASPPAIELFSPAKDFSTSETTVEITGRVSDDVMVKALALEVEGRAIDITREMKEDGTFSYTASIGPEPGPYPFVLNATDNVGLYSVEIMNVTLMPPPDTTPPLVEINDPKNGQRIFKGDVITVRGNAFDSGGLSSLIVHTPNGVKDMIASYQGYSWQFTEDTSSWPAGGAVIRVEATDLSNNSATASVRVEIFSRDQPSIDRDDPVIVVTSPSAGAPIDIRSVLEISGHIIDDSDELSLHISHDSGASYEDISHLLSQKTFYYSTDAISLIDGVPKTTSLIISHMETYHFILKAMDGSGNEAMLSIALKLVDDLAPVIMRLDTELDPKTGERRVILEAMDDSMVDGIIWVLEDDSGSQVLQGSVHHNLIEFENDLFRASWPLPRSLDHGLYKLRLSVLDPFMNEGKGTLSIHVKEEDKDVAGIDMFLAAPLAAFVIIAAVLMVVIYVRKKT